MKKKMVKALFLLLAGIALTGCGDRYDRDGKLVDMATDQFTVRAEHWIWNEYYRRLEYVRDWKAIDNYMYENGAVSCGVFIREQTAGGRNEYEVLRALPFVHTYFDEVNQKNYTRTIGYDITPGSIAFYIQDSDLAYIEGADQDYTFKATLFWRERYE